MQQKQRVEEKKQQLINQTGSFLSRLQFKASLVLRQEPQSRSSAALILLYLDVSSSWLLSISFLNLLLLLNMNPSAPRSTEASVYCMSACRKVET